MARSPSAIFVRFETDEEGNIRSWLEGEDGSELTKPRVVGRIEHEPVVQFSSKVRVPLVYKVV